MKPNTKLIMAFGIASALTLSCASPNTTGLPRRFVPLDEWPRYEAILEQAREVCQLKTYADGAYAPDLHGPYLELCERWRAVESYGESVNAWRGRRWWGLREQ